MSGKSAFGEALYDLYRTYCDRKELSQDRGVSQFQTDAETGPGKLDRVLRGDRQWVSSRMIETILEGLYNEGEGTISQGEQALWRKHLHTMRVLTILVHSFRTDVIEDEAAVLPEPLVHQLKTVSHRSYETVIASVTKASEKESGTQGYARGAFDAREYAAPRWAAPPNLDQPLPYRPTGSAGAPLHDAVDDGFAPFPQELRGRDADSEQSRTSNVGEAHRRAVERRQAAQQAGEERPTGYGGMPQRDTAVGQDAKAPVPLYEWPRWITIIRAGWRRLRVSSRSRASQVSTTISDKSSRSPIPLSPRRSLATRNPIIRPVAGDSRPYPLTLDWREIAAWLAGKEENEIVALRDDSERCLLAVYLHARDDVDVTRTVRYSFFIKSETLRWQHPDTAFWIERPLAPWERAIRQAEETRGWSSLGLRAGDELAIMRHVIGASAVDHVVGAVRAQSQFRNAHPSGHYSSPSREHSWSSVGDG